MNTQKPDKLSAAKDKLSRIRVDLAHPDAPLKKPDWIRVKLRTGTAVSDLKSKLRAGRLVTVCEEASCPNLNECFSHGTATFMIMGDTCTRRCTFCDVRHGRPNALDPDEPAHVAETVADLDLRYVVITSVDRDDLKDGGSGHFVEVIQAIREKTPATKIEILVPDFRGRLETALDILSQAPSDVFNHNVETVPDLYKPVRPGSDYQHSLTLLAEHKKRHPNIPTKSGLMLGLGETEDQVKKTLEDLRAHDVDMLTVGQYLQPTPVHHPVRRYAHPDEFARLKDYAHALGFTHAACGPMVRSSYHADLQAAGETVS